MFRLDTPDPVTFGQETFYPGADACFACDPPYEHTREWIPNSYRSGRALVLCFDGTGNSFSEDVSQLRSQTVLET